MKGVVFQTSAMMITAKELKRSPNQSISSEINGRLLTKPLSGAQANCQEKAATTVMIPYGVRTAERVAPRPKIARYMTRAIAIPSTSSIETETRGGKTGVRRSVHQRAELGTAGEG